MSRDYKLIGAYRLEDGPAVWTRKGNPPAGAWTKTTLVGGGWAAGLYYPESNDAVDDLINLFYDRVDPAGDLTAAVDQDTGIVTLTNTHATDDIEMWFSDPTGGSTDASLSLRQALFNDTSTDLWSISANGGTLSGSFAHAFGMYPSRIYMEDLPASEPRGAQAVSDGGNVTTTRIRSVVKHRLGVRLKDALPRTDADTYNEYHQYTQFRAFAETGLPFRFYPDKTVTVAYSNALAASPQTWGYSTYVLARESWGWTPQPVSGNWYAHFDDTMMLIEYNAP